MSTLTRDGRVLLRNCRGVVCAVVLPDGTLYREVERSRHLLRKPAAWCFECEVLRQAEAHGAHTVLVVDRETGERFSAPLARFWTQGFPVSRGWSEQVGLTLNHWHRQHPAQMTLF